MQIEKDLHNYIKIFNNPMPEKALSSFLKIATDTNNYVDASILGSSEGPTIKKEIRNTQQWFLTNIRSKTLTEAHWANFFTYFFTKSIEKYLNDYGIQHQFRIQDIQVLKYSKGGHYQFHVDHFMTAPRTFSCIFFLNDEYEGGDLIFKYPSGGAERKIEKKKNTLIVWPSNFLYPHTVTPIIKGTRYSVVSWAL